MKKTGRQRVGALRAGAARREITSTANGARVRDPLYVKALVLDDGRTRLALLTLDTTAIGGRGISGGILGDGGEDFLPRLRARLEREFGIPGAHVLANASHTHPPGRLLCSDDEQVARAADAVRGAVRALEPVRVGAGCGREARVAMNRDLRLKNGRDWTIRHSHPCPPDDAVAGVGPADPEVGILRVDRLDGRPLAVVYNFACHPLFGDARGSLTANFPGAASGVIEQALPGCLALFLQGAGGNVCDVEFKDFERPRDIEPLGLRLGLSVLRALPGIKARAGRLRALSETIRLPRRTDIAARLAALYREQERLLESLRGTSLNFKAFLPLFLKHRLDPRYPAAGAYRYLQARAIGDTSLADMDAFTRKAADKYLGSIRAMEALARLREDRATLEKHEALNRAAGEPTAAAEIMGLRIGPAAVITAPAELLVEIGLRLKKASPHKPTLVAALTNGYLHYGAPAAAYDRGGYEVTECLLAPEWQRIYEAKAIELIRAL